MRPTVTSESILDPELYTEYAAQWLNKISELDNPDLPGYFNDGDQRVAYATFSIQRIIELVSAVGVRRIKARFVLLPVQTDEQYRFSLVLFASDDDNRQLTAFYLPDAMAAPFPSLPTEPVPGGLAGLWEANWLGADTLTTAMFTTSYGPLEGYNFEIDDFLAPLFTDTADYTDQQIRLKLGLHQYVAAGATSPSQTFGLVVRRFDPSQQAQAKAASAGFFDLSTPCPPMD
ncbi:hypothetical protein [Hymenobacter ruricola]|uniref:Uncharacterized protein n=1 Tax=Hymenobacter ruricola TaxID=2791023 RepID=A0ABS0I317_9BACT|nr:hypothetical protein [Hymenobacter ruricola]MBF9221181.1 hypothetical protein [Hymenobacter ruricola]